MGLGSPSRHALPSDPGPGHTDGSAGAGSARVPAVAVRGLCSRGDDTRGLGSTSRPPPPAPPQHFPAPSTRPRAPSCLCAPLPCPTFGFNSGRAAVKDPPTPVSSGFLSRSRFSAPHPPFSATLPSITALPARVRSWLGAPESPRHLRSLGGTGTRRDGPSTQTMAAAPQDRNGSPGPRSRHSAFPWRRGAGRERRAPGNVAPDWPEGSGRSSALCPPPWWARRPASPRSPPMLTE